MRGIESSNKLPPCLRINPYPSATAAPDLAGAPTAWGGAPSLTAVVGAAVAAAGGIGKESPPLLLPLLLLL